MTAPIVGIDLGTTNSVIAYTDVNGVTHTIAGTDGARIVPSAVYFPSGDDPVVGERAKQYALVEPDRVARLFKRGMGEKSFLPDDRPFVVDAKVWSPEELSALVLRKLKQMAEQHFGEPVPRAVITVPAYFGEAERAATQHAGEMAGFEVERIINEPTAAALAHGLDEGSPEGKVLVFDLGGGTFDVTVMTIAPGGEGRVIAIGGDRRLGGIDFDQRILEQVTQVAIRETGVDIASDPWALADATAKAEDMKKELSTAMSSTRPITAGGRPVMFTLIRDQFEALIADTLQDVKDTVENTIEQAGLPPSAIDHALMVGGSSRIPAFQRLLEGVCGRQPVFTRNLDEDVARGAAILAAKLGGKLDPRSELARLPVPVDVASHGLGITVVDSSTRRHWNKVMIPAGSPIPGLTEETVYTLEDRQAKIEVTLNEGDDEELQFVRKLGSSRGDLGRPVRIEYPIRVTMEYTADQLIRVKAYDGETGAFLCDLEVRHESLISDEAREEATSYITSLSLE